MEIVEHHLFQVTRNKLSIEEDEAPDLLMAIEELRRRRFGEGRPARDRALDATRRRVAC